MHSSIFEFMHLSMVALWHVLGTQELLCPTDTCRWAECYLFPNRITKTDTASQLNNMATGEQSALDWEQCFSGIGKHRSLGNAPNPRVWGSTLAYAIEGSANLKCTGQASRLETQAGIHAAVLRQDLFSRKPQFLLRRPSNWLDEAQSPSARLSPWLQVN